MEKVASRKRQSPNNDASYNNTSENGIAPSLNSVSEVTVVKDRLSKRKDKIEQFAR